MKLTTTIDSVQVRVENIQEEALAFLKKYGFNPSADVNCRNYTWFIVYFEDKLIGYNDEFRPERAKTLLLDYADSQALIEENFKPVFVFELGKKYYSHSNYVVPIEHWPGKIVLGGRDDNPFKLYNYEPTSKTDAIDYIKIHFPYDSPKTQD